MLELALAGVCACSATAPAGRHARGMHERTNHPGILFRSTVDEVPARPSHALSNLRIRYPSRLLIYVQYLIAQGSGLLLLMPVKLTAAPYCGVSCG